MPLSSVPRAALVAALLLSSGCSSQPGPELGDVSGVVTFNGHPLARATIEFQPRFAGGAPSYATTNREGIYTLRFSRNRPGAMLGQHVVRITTYRLEEPPGEPRREIPEMLPAKYHAQSELKREVTSGQNQIDFHLDSQ